MIANINNLKKIDDILNSEGSILALYKLGDQLYLASYLNDNTGMVYYSSTRDILIKYLNGHITLQELYLDNEDIIVTHKFKADAVSYLKQDFIDKIQYGYDYYPNLSDGIKNPNIREIINII